MEESVVQFVQLGALGIFAYLMLRHVLKQSSEFATMLHNHMEEDNKVQRSIYESLEAIQVSLRGIADRVSSRLP